MKKMFFAFLFLVLLYPTLSAQEQLKIPSLRISVSGGSGYLTASGGEVDFGAVNKEKIDRFVNDLQWTSHLNADVHYYIWKNYGIGVKYYMYKTSAEATDVITNLFDENYYLVGDMRETDYINYFGPSINEIIALGDNSKFFLNSTLSAGYMWWRSEASMFYTNTLITGGNFAMNADLGLDYLFNSNLGIGLNVGVFLGYIDKVKWTDGTTTREEQLDKDSRYNAANFNFSLGLRYYFNK